MDRNARSSRQPARKFEYRQRSADDVARRAESGANQIDTYIRDSIKLFTPKEGDNLIRIMPPTWDDAKHYGFDLYLHYGIGTDNAAYPCLEKMKGEMCPICEARKAAADAGDTELADKLKPNRRVLVWMVDRNDEKSGPVIWSMPWTIDRDLCKLSTDARTGEFLAIDDPENGFDVEFERKGKAQRTEYIGLRIARRSSELGDDDWLDLVVNHPIPELINYYDYDHIKRAFSGGSRAQRESEPGGDRGGSGKRGTAKHSYEEVQAMSARELEDLYYALDLPGDLEQFGSDAELAAAICEALGVQPAELPRRERSARGGEDIAEGMGRLRRRSTT